MSQDSSSSSSLSQTETLMAVHGGVGFKTPDDASLWCAKALQGAPDIVQAVANLENHKYFNCGIGSNLTNLGTVECEAAYMSTQQFKFGGVGCLGTVRNPIRVARALANDDGIPGLVAPQVLVGGGAELWAREKGFEMVDPGSLVSNSARKQWETVESKVEAVLKNEESCMDGERMDTVGGVSIADGEADACVSSGGIFYKRTGRLGQSTLFGSGIWTDKKDSAKIAISASGCGEALMRTDFCRSLSRAVMNRHPDQMAMQAIERWFREEFVASPYLGNLSPANVIAGGIVMLQEQGCTELFVFHNAPFFPIAYQSPRFGLQRLISRVEPGQPLRVDSYPL